MKKIIYKNFESFLMFVNWFLKRKLQVLFVLCFASCTVHNYISRENFKRISSNFSGKFYDHLDTIVAQYDNRIYTKSFMKQLTNVENINYLKPIQIDIKDKELFLSFEDIHKNQYVLKFYGKRSKSKFVFYTNYETISFPIVFITKNVTKYSVFMPTEKEIMFEDSHTNEGMFLLFGAENSSKSDYKFKLLKNE